MNPFRRSALFAFAIWPFGSALAADPTGSNTTQPSAVGTALVGQIPGSVTNDSANAGNVGEYSSASLPLGSAIPLSTGVTTSIVSLGLSAGDWHIWGQAVSIVPAATNMTVIASGLNSNATTMPSATTGGLTQLAFGTAGVNGGGSNFINVGPIRLSLTTTATTFLLASATFATSTASMYGSMQARRMR